VLLVQLMIGCSRAEPTQSNAATTTAHAATPRGNGEVPAEAKLIVAFGDSLYAGYQLGANEGFAPALERALHKAHIDARVVNAGVSGDTSAAGLQRLAFTLDGLLPRKPDLVLVGLGGNDMLRGLAPVATRSNLDAILAELKRRHVPAMLTGMVASPNMGQDYAAAFNSIYPDLARKYEVSLYPFFLDGVVGRRELILPDGIHPNAKGVTVIVENVSARVIKAVQMTGPPR
jgi:acyl-CoA thioesterase-1